MHTVKDCCCGCTLRTGTLILLILSVVFGLWQLAGYFMVSSQKDVQFSDILLPSIRGLIALGAAILGIYALNTKKPSCLIPYLIVQVIGIVYVLILMILVAFIGTVAISGTSSQDKSEAFGGIIVVEIALLITGAISYYFFVVVLSYYKELAAETGV